MNNIQEIEEYLLKKQPVDEGLLFQAKLILDAELRENLFWQDRTYRLIDLYGKNQLKKELEHVHSVLFSDKKYQSFRERLLSFFSRK